MAVLEKQIAAYHSVVDNYGKLIEGFCTEKDSAKKRVKRKEIYRRGKDRTLEAMEKEKEVDKYNNIFSYSTNIATYSEDNAEKTFEELKRYYEKELRYNKELHLDIDLPDENGNEHARYRNRNQIRGLIKTLCAITAVCQENQIPLTIETGWHVDDFGYCDGVDY